MNIQTLKIHNIASIENAQIDFNQSPLADDPIFLITGETGSGKTTILNAICLALYNQVPCLKRIGSAEVDKEGLQTNNPRQLLRRGTGEGEIELSFIGNDEKHYIATWRVQRARKRFDGNYQDIVRQLYIQEEGRMLSRKAEIESQILTAIGLTFEQFTRTTMLAQGQFANFMMANDNEKSEILEKLTGTEIYASIGQRIFALMQEKVLEYNALDNQIKGVALLTEEEKEALRQKIIDLSAQIQACDATLKTLDVQLQWLQKETELKTFWNEKALEQEKAEADASSDDNKQLKAIVSEWEMTASVRNQINLKDKEDQELADTKKRLDDLAKTYQDIANGLEWQKKQLEKILSDKTEIDKKLEADSVHAEMYAHVGQIKMLAHNVEDFVNEQQRQEQEQVRIEKEKGQADLQMEQLQSVLTTATNQFNAQNETVLRLEKTLDAIDLPNLTRRVSELNDAILKSASTINCLKQWQQAQREWDEAQRLLQEVLDERASLKDTLEKNALRLPDLEMDYAQKKGFLAGLMQLNDHITALRQRFKEQEICPLCGSQMSRLHSDDTLHSQLATAKEQEQASKAALEEANNTAAVIQTRLKALASIITSRQKQAQEKQRNTIAAQEMAQQAHPNYNAPNAIAEQEHIQTNLKSQHQAERLSLDKAISLQNTLETARKTLEEIRKKKEEAQGNLLDQTQKTASLEQQEKNNAELINKAKAQIEKNLKDLSGLVTEGIKVSAENARRVSDYIEKRAHEYTRYQNESTRLSALHESHAQQMASCQKTFSVIKDRFVIQSHPIPVEVPDLEAAISDFIAKVHAIEGAMQQTQVKISELNDNIEHYFAQPDSVTRERVVTLNRLTPDTITSYKQKVETVDKRLSDAKTMVRTIGEQMESHRLTRPYIEEGATTETLTEVRNAKAEEREAANNDSVAIRTQLEKDHDMAESLSEKHSRLETLRKEKNDWEVLDRNFGGADGKKFRNIAQSYVLRALLNKANYYMSKLSNRYTLDCEDGSLTINVIDKHQGNAIRNVGLLSGGEGFVASLALALGLSSISNSKLNVDTLFIDEGFGTLSGDYLETVIDTLDRLHQIGGRRVGIISHVEGLKERIPTQICLKCTGPSSSEVRVVTR